ncbi:unnamed protein product [Pieris macdunnoughi]|uniref:Uncharacterized protein n=1 Tax=Pieris macdunnoughi TaxID=345717 RepID=A0A821XXE2_9NEOP|nr:unnamed protein product [Pieris macdunnoughi]
MLHHRLQISREKALENIKTSKERSKPTMINTRGLYSIKVIAILCNVTLAESENQYVKNIVKGPGIFFDPVSTLKIINDQFHIVIPVEIIPIQNHIMDINKVFNNVQSYCQRSEVIGVSQCHNLLQPLEAILKDLQRDFNAVSHLVSDNYISKRSAWFSGIGTVFKHIFGTLTEDDAKTYEDAIKTLYENDKKISGTLKKTVIASQSAISNINQSLHEMNLNQAKLNGVVKQLASSVSNITDAFNEAANAPLPSAANHANAIHHALAHASGPRTQKLQLRNSKFKSNFVLCIQK